MEDVVGATPVHGSEQDEFDSSVADVVLAADAMHDTEFNAAQLTPAPFLGAAVAGLSPCEEKKRAAKEELRKTNDYAYSAIFAGRCIWPFLKIPICNSTLPIFIGVASMDQTTRRSFIGVCRAQAAIDHRSSFLTTFLDVLLR